MSAGACKLLLTLVAGIFLGGCKLAVTVGEGGTVQSASKTRNCAEVSQCVFEVSEANFEETFTAVPLPGYRFERWQSGPGYLCLNTPGPNCVLTNVVFKEVPPILAIIASDAVFTIRPVFKPIADGKLVVKDANGLLLGEVVNLKNGTDAAVRQVFLDKHKKEHGYMVDVSRMFISDTHGYSVYWQNTNCAGNKVLAPSPMILEPLFSNRYVVARKEKGRTETLFLLELSPPEEAKLRKNTYAIEDGICQPSKTNLPLVAATIVGNDYGSRYTPPFGVYSQ
jgi:hypothetical protein